MTLACEDAEFTHPFLDNDELNSWTFQSLHHTKSSLFYSPHVERMAIAETALNQFGICLRIKRVRLIPKVGISNIYGRDKQKKW